MVKRGFWILSAVTTVLWLLSKPALGDLAIDPARTFAQFAGLVGITLLAWDFFLAARFQFIDKAFGGLDRVFKEHRRAGTWAFVLMLAHPIFLVLSALPRWSVMKLYILPSTIWEYNWGIFALWGFFILLSLTLFAKMPYHVWKASHKMLGIPFALVALHVGLVHSDVSYYLPLRVWILTLTIVSLALYIYKVFLYRFIGPKYAYSLLSVREMGDVVEMTLKAKGKPMAFYPGQFVFLSVMDASIGKEEHPFSVSSCPEEEMLPLSVKKSGDWTAKLSALKAGMDVMVYGPYGRFGEKFVASEDKSLWIAGGIGVTPFLSMMRYTSANELNRDVMFYYSTKNASEAVYGSEMQDMKMPTVKVRPHFSEKEGFLTAEKIAEEVKDLKDRRIFLCGPPGMMKALTEGFLKLGVPRRKIVFEEFKLR